MNLLGEGDSNRGTTFIILAIVFGSLSTITTLIRIRVRSIKHQLGWDDFAIGLASVLIVVELVFNGLEGVVPDFPDRMHYKDWNLPFRSSH